MLKIILDETELNNLILFLKRIPLTGDESYVYVKLIQQFQKAEKVEE